MNNQSNDSPFGKINLTKPVQKSETPVVPVSLQKPEKSTEQKNIDNNFDKPEKTDNSESSQNNSQELLQDYNKSKIPEVSSSDYQTNVKTVSNKNVNINENPVNTPAPNPIIPVKQEVPPAKVDESNVFQRKSPDSASSNKTLFVIIAVLLFVVGIMSGVLLSIKNKQEDSNVGTPDISYMPPTQSDTPTISEEITDAPTMSEEITDTPTTVTEENITEATTIDTHTEPPKTNPPATEPPTKAPEKSYYVRKSWNDSDSQIGAYESFDNAKSACISGYSIFDKSGSLLYTHESSLPQNELFQYGIVNTVRDPLNMREKPNTSSKIIYEVPLGAGVEILGEEGDFYYANYTRYGTDGISVTGYLKKDYILESIEIKSLCPIKGQINCHNMGISSFTTTYVALGGSKTFIRKSLGDKWHVTAKNMCESYDVVWYELWDTDDGDYYGWVDAEYIDFY